MALIEGLSSVQQSGLVAGQRHCRAGTCR